MGKRDSPRGQAGGSHPDGVAVLVQRSHVDLGDAKLRADVPAVDQARLDASHSEDARQSWRPCVRDGMLSAGDPVLQTRRVSWPSPVQSSLLSAQGTDAAIRESTDGAGDGRAEKGEMPLIGKKGGKGTLVGEKRGQQASRAIRQSEATLAIEGHSGCDDETLPPPKAWHQQCSRQLTVKTACHVAASCCSPLPDAPLHTRTAPSPPPTTTTGSSFLLAKNRS